MRLLLVVEDPHAVVERAVGLGAAEVVTVAEEHGWLLGRIEVPVDITWRSAGRRRLPGGGQRQSFSAASPR